MIQRRGMDKGSGKGYRNLVLKDPVTHSMNARGIKSRNQFILPPKVEFNKYDFGTIPTDEKKGLIKDIARKVVDGVDWAIHWEREHLPEQKQWVKDQFDKAKQLSIKSKDNVTDINESREKDLEDVRDELDIDDDGVQDINVSELEDVNDNIKLDLESIDLDNNSVPDAVEDNFFNIEKESKVSTKPTSLFEVPSPPKPPKSNLFTKVKGQVNEFIEARKLEAEEIKGLSDRKLREFAIKEGKPLFGELNKFEKEIVRREESKIRLNARLKQSKAESKKRIKERLNSKPFLSEVLGL